MNEAPSNQSGLSDTFSSQPAPQTNPFTADLKGEFTSNFGTNTNAVSQIFKEGGFVSQNRTKYLIIGGVLIVVLAVVFYMLTDDSTTETEVTDETPTEGDTDEDPDTVTDEKPEETPTETATEEATATDTATPTVPVTNSVVKSSGFSGGSGQVTLSEPADGSSLNYDETQGPATFNWTGGSGYIVFSRNQSMNPPAMKVAVSGNSFAFHHPWPGTWYWQVTNKSGSTEVRSFKVSAPARRNVQLSQPTSGGAVAGNGGTVSWQGDSKVAYYRVEFSTGGWANPQHRFASSGNSVQLQGVAPGQYQMRVGAFSEVAGRWEYTAAVPVTVQ